MSVFGVTKGTKLEERIDSNGKGEEAGAGLYAALAYLAKERGLTEMSEVLMQISTDEARHAGLYAVLNGKANQDIFEMLKKIAPIESNAFVKLHEFAKCVRDLGLEEAAEQIEAVALDERRHGEILSNLIKNTCK